MRYNFPVWNHISEIGGIIDEKNGTLDSLIQQYIYSADGSDATPVEFAHFDGAETIRFAVTGDVPPIDYIDPSGTPAGFNTAVLSEMAGGWARISSWCRSTAALGARSL